MSDDEEKLEEKYEYIKPNATIYIIISRNGRYSPDEFKKPYYNSAFAIVLLYLDCTEQADHRGHHAVQLFQYD